MKPFSARVHQLPPSLSVHRSHTGRVTVGTLWLGSAEGAVSIEERDFWSDSTDLINSISLDLGANLERFLCSDQLSRFDLALKDLFFFGSKSLFYKKHFSQIVWSGDTEDLQVNHPSPAKGLVFIDPVNPNQRSFLFQAIENKIFMFHENIKFC